MGRAIIINSLNFSASNLGKVTRVNNIPITGITISGNATGYTEESIQLTANITPSNASNQTIIWQSSNTNIATINETGNILCIATGQTNITASSTDGSGIVANFNLNVYIDLPAHLFKAVISFAGLSSATVTEFTTFNNETVNLVYPTWGATGINEVIKDTKGKDRGLYLRNTSDYPTDISYSIPYINKSPVEANFISGLYPFELLKSHAIPSSANNYKKGITRYTFPNGTYTINILSCSSSNAYTTEVQSRCYFKINTETSKALTHDIYYNNSQYTTFENVVVTDGIIDVIWTNVAGYYFYPGVNLIEIIRTA